MKTNHRHDPTVVQLPAAFNPVATYQTDCTITITKRALFHLCRLAPEQPLWLFEDVLLVSLHDGKVLIQVEHTTRQGTVTKRTSTPCVLYEHDAQTLVLDTLKLCAFERRKQRGLRIRVVGITRLLGEYRFTPHAVLSQRS